MVYTKPLAFLQRARRAKTIRGDDNQLATMKADLSTGSIGKWMVKLAVPSIVAQLINALYNIVDRIYIGHMGADGSLALTGVGVCFPILMVISAFSAFVGMGGGPRASIAMGQKNMEGAERILSNCFTLLLGISIVLTAVLLPLREPLLLSFGASQDTLPYAESYLAIYLCGTVFVQMSLGMNTFITVQGRATISMLTVLIGAVINIGLDPLFIYTFGMGVQGAALATVISQAVSCAWVLQILFGRRSSLRIRPAYLRPQWKILAPVMALGLSPFIMQATESAINVVFNTQLQAYGGDPAVGAMTICSSILQMMFLPMQGLAQGAQPIISFNYGARKPERVRRTFMMLLVWEIFFYVLLFLACQLMPNVLVSLFNDNPALTEHAVWALRIYMAGCIMMAVQGSCQQTCVALGESKISLFFALLRKVILLIPLAYLFPLIFTQDPEFGIFLAEPVADITCATIVGITFFFRFPKLMQAISVKDNSSSEKGA